MSTYSKWFFAYIIFVFPLTCYAQRRTLPIQKASPSKQIQRLDSLGNYYESTVPDSSVWYYKAALKAATILKDTTAKAFALNRLGKLYIYVIKDETKALQYLNESIIIATKTNSYANLARSHMLLWVIAVHQNLKNRDDLLDLALEYATKSTDWRLIKDAYEFKATYYKAMGDDENEEKAILNVLEIAKKNDIDSWFSVGLDYGELLERMGKIKQAKAHYLKLELTKDKLTKSKGYFVYMNDLARLELKLKKYEKAEKLITELLSYETSQAKIDTFHLSFIHKNLYDLYLAKKDYKNALKIREAIESINAWLDKKRQSQESKLKITELKAQLDLERQELAMIALKTKQEEQLIVLIATLIIVALLIGSVLLLQRSKNKITFQKTELTNLNTTKDKLFTILSHDLRSPVANLENNLMLTNWGALNQAEFSESVHELGQEVQQVRAMLENMLYWSISQMKELKASPKSTFVLPIIEEQLQLLNPSIKAKNILFVNSIPPKLRLLIDENHLRIILRNLFQNALKYSHQNGKIIVSFREDGESNYLEIEDKGVGMNQERLENLFRFGESSVGTNLEAGTGVGLLLVEEFVRLNRLRITVQSQVGEGSVFTIQF